MFKIAVNQIIIPKRPKEDRNRWILKNWNLKFILKKTAIGRSIKNANVNLACAICNGLTPSPNMLLPKIFAIILPEANASEANIIKIMEIVKGL